MLYNVIYATHWCELATNARAHPRDGAWRVDEVFLRPPERLTPARRPAGYQYGADGEDSGADTDQRPLLPETRL